jgi:hypothetical protein
MSRVTRSPLLSGRIIWPAKGAPAGISIGSPAERFISMCGISTAAQVRSRL